MNFAISADQKMKIKESKKSGMYLHLPRELRKLWNMRVTVIPIMIGALGTVPKGLETRLEESEIRGWIETIQTTAKTEKMMT